MDPATPAPGDDATPISATVAWISFGSLVGSVGALVAFIDGIVLMAKGHPHVGEGLAISAIALSVGVLVLLLAHVATVLARASES